MHQDYAFRDYLAWYQTATWIKLRQRWANEDYVNVGSSEDEDTLYDTRTRDGSHVETGLVLDHVVCFLSILYMLFKHCFLCREMLTYRLL
jgi:hypothetical protein